MLLVSRDETFETKLNWDDALAKVENIPTINSINTELEIYSNSKFSLIRCHEEVSIANEPFSKTNKGIEIRIEKKIDEKSHLL